MAGTAIELKTAMEGSAERLAPLLPASITPQKFIRIALDAVNRNPELKQCDPQTVVDACAQAAKDNLVLDGREAALVIYNRKVPGRNGEKDTWKKVAQYIPMVLGMRKRMYATGQISTMETGIVYEKEIEEKRFDWQAGTDAFLIHRPLLHDDLGKQVAVYSVVTMVNGTKSVEVMRWSEVLKIARSQPKNRDDQGNLKGIWRDHLGEMARKTVLRRHSKQLPFDSDLAEMFARVDNFNGPDDNDVDETEESDTTKKPAGKKAGAGREKLRQSRAAKPDNDKPQIDREADELEPVTDDAPESQSGDSEDDDRI